MQDEDTEPYVLPPLGKPYQQVWDEEDRLIAQSLPVPIISSTSPYRPNPNGGPVNKSLDYPRMSRKEFEYDSRELKEEDLVVEDKGAGPLTERVVSALLAAREEADAPIGFLPPASGEGSSSGGASGAKGMQVDQAAGQVGEGAWGGPLDPGPERLGMGDMEARMRKELQAVGLLGEEEVSLLMLPLHRVSAKLTLSNASPPPLLPFPFSSPSRPPDRLVPSRRRRNLHLPPPNPTSPRVPNRAQYHPSLDPPLHRPGPSRLRRVSSVSRGSRPHH